MRNFTAYPDIYYSQEYVEYRYDNLQPSQRSGLLYHMQLDYNLHTHNPITKVHF